MIELNSNAVSGGLLHSNVSETSSMGLFDVLPEWITASIFSSVDQPAVMSLLCKKMRTLVPRSIEIQNTEKGMSAAKLSSIAGYKIDPRCLSMLGMVFPEIFSLKSKDDILKKVGGVVDNTFTLLEDPVALRRFFALKSTKEVAEYFYGKNVFEQKPSVDSKPSTTLFQKTLQGIRWIFGYDAPKSSAVAVDKEEKGTEDASLERDVLSVIRKKQPTRTFPCMLVREVDDTYSIFPSVSLRVLNFPPVEICDHLSGEHLNSLCIEKTSNIPASIRKFKNIQHIAIDASPIFKLPEEIGSLPLKSIRFRNCRNLESLPASLAEVPSLKEVFLEGCGKITKNNPVIQKLLSKNTKVSFQ